MFRLVRCSIASLVYVLTGESMTNSFLSNYGWGAPYLS